MVILPYGFEGDGMLWQALSAFHFRMAGGYTGFAPPIPAEYERWPIVDALYDVAPVPDAGGQFKAFLKSHDVGAVIFAGEGDHAIEASHAGGPGIWHRGPIAPRDREVWNVILGGLDVAAQNVGGVTLYQLPAQVRAQWPSEDLLHCRRVPQPSASTGCSPQLTVTSPVAAVSPSCLLSPSSRRVCCRPTGSEALCCAALQRRV